MRSLNLDQLRAFVEVVERGSFTAAAKELNLTQPAVTHQIQELERRFQVSLVERFGKRAYLTQAGEKLIEHARSLLDEDSRTQVTMRRFGDGWLGRVRVGTSKTLLMYVLPPILRQLKTDHPQLEINLKTGLTPLILGSENSALRRTVADWLALAGPPPRPLMEFDNVEAMKSVVAVGLGASIVPSLSLGAGHVTMANTIVRPLSPRASRRVGLVRLRGKRGTDGMELVFAELLTLRQRPAARST